MRFLLQLALLLISQNARYVPEDHRPGLFFRETWKDPEVQERKVVQADLTNSALELKLYIVTTRTEPGWAMNPDLTKVDEVGFTDLVRGSGGGAGGGSRVDWIEVYGNPVPRNTPPASQHD